MEAEYRRETTHVYMMIREEPGFTGTEYETKTVENNVIPGLLKMQSESLNGRKYYRYDISDLKPFQGYCRMIHFGRKEVQKLLSLILSSIVRFEDYLLDADHLLLDPEFLYAAPDGTRIEMAYVPFYQEDFRVQLRRLLEFIMLETDGSDHEAVVFICRMMHELGEVNAEPGSLLRIVMHDGKRPAEPRDFAEHASGPSGRDGGGVFQPSSSEENGPEKYAENVSGRAEGTGACGCGSGEMREDKDGKKCSRTKKKCPGRKKSDAEKARSIAPEKETLWIAAAGMGAAVLVYLGLHFFGFAALGTETMAAFSAAAGGAVLLAAVMIGKMKKNTVRTDEEETWKYPAPLFQGAGDFMQEEIIKDGGRKCPETEREETVMLDRAGRERAGEGAFLQPDPPSSALPVIRLESEDILIGKQSGAVDAVIPENTVSRVHARIVRRDGKYYISDLGSRNGTGVDGEQLAGESEKELMDGAHVTFAACRYVFVKGRQGAAW